MLKLNGYIRQIFSYFGNQIITKALTSTMAATPQRALLVMILLLCFFHPCADTADECVIHNASVFENNNVTFAIRSEVKPDFTIGGQDQYSIDPNLQSLINYTTNGDCHYLTFPARPEFDKADIAFYINGSRVGKAILRVQGVLGQPINLTLERLNATHGVVSWDQPQSRVEPPSARYVLNINRIQVILNYTSYKFQWPFPLAGQINISVTAFNPVGEGGTSSLIRPLQCDYLNDLIPMVFPYYDMHGNVQIRVKLQLNDTGVYCCHQENVIVTHQNPDTNEMIFILRWKGGGVDFVMGNVSQPQHMNDTFSICSDDFHISYSTYKVQRVNVSGERERIVQCYFIEGATNKECYVEVYLLEMNYFGSSKYVINSTKAGNYTVKVYDEKKQETQGIRPAYETSFVLSGETKNDSSFIAPLVAGLVLLVIGVLAVAGLVYYCRQKSSKTKKPDINVRGAILVTSPEEQEQGAMESGIEHRTVTRLQQPHSAVSRHEGPEAEEIEMIETNSHFVDVPSCPLGENEDREYSVVEGLEDTIVSDKPPEQQTMFDKNSTTMA